MPKGPKCPICQSLLTDSECPNMDCPQKVAEWILRWCGPDAVNIPAINDEIAMRLAKLQLVIHPGELYELSIGDWQRIDGLSEQVQSEITYQLEESKNASPAALLYGYRIKGVDTRLAKRLVETFGNTSKLMETKPDQLATIAGVDVDTATVIRRWFRDTFNKKMLMMLERNGFRVD